MTTSSTKRFDLAAKDWDRRPTSQQLAALPAEIMARVAFDAGDSVLDFGAGTGLLATAIAPHVAKVTALDTSEGMLQVLAQKGVANIRILQQDIFEGLPERYDVIVSCMAMHHVADTAGLLQAFAKSLKPGGRIALVDLYAEDGSFHGDNAAKGVQHFGFEPAAVQSMASDAGFTGVALNPVWEIQRDSGRTYPLFILSGQVV